VSFGTHYRANFSVIGSKIVLSRPSGYAELGGVKKSLDLIDRLIAETIPLGGNIYVYRRSFKTSRCCF